MDDPFKLLEAITKTLEREEKKVERKKQNKADWTDPAEKRAYIADYKRKQREKWLPNPRVCPCCGETKPQNRQWVVFARTKLIGAQGPEVSRVRSVYGSAARYAVCRTCAMYKFDGALWSKPAGRKKSDA